MLKRPEVEAMAVPVTEAVLVAVQAADAVVEPVLVYALINERNTHTK